MSKKIENTPQKIYLQIGDEEINDFNELTEVSWCEDKVCDTDIEYVISKEQPSSSVTDEEIEKQPYCPYCGHKKGYKVSTDINSGKECKNPFCKKQ